MEPIFSGEVLSQANQVSRDLSSRIAKIRKMKAEIMNPGTFAAGSNYSSNSTMEVRRLKLQNGLLIVSKRISQAKLISKQVFFGRWRCRVQG